MNLFLEIKRNVPSVIVNQLPVMYKSTSSTSSSGRFDCWNQQESWNSGLEDWNHYRSEHHHSSYHSHYHHHHHHGHLPQYSTQNITNIPHTGEANLVRTRPYPDQTSYSPYPAPAGNQTASSVNETFGPSR